MFLTYILQYIFLSVSVLLLREEDLQRTPGAAALQRRLHLLRVRRAVRAAERHLPSPGLGDAAADAGGRRRLAGPGTAHAGNPAGGGAGPHGLVALQLLPQHLPLAAQL